MLKVQGEGCRVQGWGFRVQGLGFRVGSGLRGLGFQVSRIKGLGVQGLGVPLMGPKGGF